MLAAERIGDPGFERLSSFHLAGELARILHQGGAYLKTDSVAAAEQLGRSFFQTLAGDRRHQIDILYAEDAWHPWFADVAWDRTLVTLDWDHDRITFLAATSSD